MPSIVGLSGKLEFKCPYTKGHLSADNIEVVFDSGSCTEIHVNGRKVIGIKHVVFDIDISKSPMISFTIEGYPVKENFDRQDVRNFLRRNNGRS